MENEQLRREAAMKRIPVSQAVEDLKARLLVVVVVVVAVAVVVNVLVVVGCCYEKYFLL